MTKAGLNSPVVNTFVDNIKIMAPKKSRIIQCVKTELTIAFSIANMGPINFYLGLKVEQDQAKQIIKLLQPAYIDNVFAKFYFNKMHTVNTLIKKTALL